MRVLIVDDETNIRRAMRIALEALGHVVAEAETPAQATESQIRLTPDVAFVDLRLGDSSGLDLLEPMLARSPRLVFVMITAYAGVDTAVESMRRGAFDYLPKPFTPSQIRAVMERVARVRGLQNQVANLENRVQNEVPEAVLDGDDPGMNKILDMARKVAGFETSILLRGENGTGKGVLARTIHGWSRRGDGPFVTVNCPGLSAELLESDLFGHVRGAFTGAVRDTVGKVASAEGGTLFLDELGDLPTALQPKLLRFLQEKRYERVGETTTRTSHVRLIAATNRDLEAAVRGGTFREDLLYRLNVVEITLPPLRDRADLGDLADHLLSFFARQVGRSFVGFSGEARAAMRQYAWPGNLRELRNTIERAAIFGDGPTIGLADLPERIGFVAGATTEAEIELGHAVRLDALEAEHIRRVLGRAASLDEAAKILGIDPSTLYRKRKQYGL